MDKSLLTGGPVSPASPFFPFLPRLPGGPGGPTHAERRVRRRDGEKENTNYYITSLIFFFFVRSFVHSFGCCSAGVRLL